MRRVFIAAALFVTACAGNAPDQPAEARVPTIVNGSPTSGFPSVIRLNMSDSTQSWLCTGTVITSHAVLTAAHCVQGATTVQGQADSAIFSNGSASTKASATQWHFHSGFDGSAGVNDLGVAIFDNHTITATPSSISNAAPASGQTITLVGYGVTSANAKDHGVKRMATTTVSSVNATTFGFANNPGNTCFGDSGGPTFLSGVLLGVHSGTSGETPCGSGIDMRVDQYVSWVQSHAPGVNVGGGGGSPDAGAPKQDSGTPPPSGGGCQPSTGKGCGGCSCQSCVCNVDPYCCNTKWDSLCVAECKTCGGCGGTQPKPDAGAPKADSGTPPPSGSGCQPAAGKGCGGCSCQSCVCNVDPYCCNTKWDDLCVAECKTCGGCDGTQPKPDAGAPKADSGTPPPSGGGCQPAAGKGCGGCSCQSCVCNVDPYCCNTKWDDLCVAECKTCGGCGGTQPKPDAGAPKADSGTPPPSGGKGPIGWLDSVAGGVAAGWACDPNSPSTSIDVHLYVGGPAGSGAAVYGVKAAQANEPAVTSACGGGSAHRFQYAIPSWTTMAGKPVHAYGIDVTGDPNLQLSGSPKTLPASSSGSSCNGHCGSKSADGSCFCDSLCGDYGDCCKDKSQYCG